MDGHYHHPDDRKFGAHLRRAADSEFGAFVAFNEAVGREDGAVPLKYRELISIAVALTTQCAYCIETNVGAASRAGATREEIAETVFVSAAIRAGGAVAHGRMAMKFFERAEASTASTA